MRFLFAILAITYLGLCQETQNVPYAIYPSPPLTIYRDKAWWGVDWAEKSTIEAYVRCYYNDDTIIKNFPDYVLQVIEWESSFNINAVSPTGARGLMQLTHTAVDHAGYNYDQVVKYPWVNIDCGVAYLKYCLKLNKGHKANAWISYRDGHWAEKKD